MNFMKNDTKISSEKNLFSDTDEFIFNNFTQFLEGNDDLFVGEKNFPDLKNEFLFSSSFKNQSFINSSQYSYDNLEEMIIKQRLQDVGFISIENLEKNFIDLETVLGSKIFEELVTSNRLVSLHNLWFLSQLTTFQIKIYMKILFFILHNRRKVLFNRQSNVYRVMRKIWYELLLLIANCVSATSIRLTGLRK